MIDYDASSWTWAFGFMCQLKGSVFPIAVAWALPASVLGFFIPYMLYEIFEDEYLEHGNLLLAVWTSLTGILGFLIVFRTQTAYARYSKGADHLRSTRTHWFNAASSLMAFCSRDEGLAVEVEKFQHLLVRLMSLLNCISLQMIADTDSEIFVVIALEGVSEESLEFLTGKSSKHHRCEIIIQWIQKLVVEAMENKVICVPPPITTRFYQELSLGASNINTARNLGADLPFPFPYAQMIAFLLLQHWICTPVILGLVLQANAAAALLTFCTVFAFFGINRIASEIESPFGMDLNDLPLALMQEDFNSSLWILLENQVEYLPEFHFEEDYHHRDWNLQEVRMSQGSQDVTGSCNLSTDHSSNQRFSGRKRMSFFAQQPQGADACRTLGVAQRVGTSSRTITGTEDSRRSITRLESDAISDASTTFSAAKSCEHVHTVSSLQPAIDAERSTKSMKSSRRASSCATSCIDCSCPQQTLQEALCNHKHRKCRSKTSISWSPSDTRDTRDSRLSANVSPQRMKFLRGVGDGANAKSTQHFKDEIKEFRDTLRGLSAAFKVLTKDGPLTPKETVREDISPTRLVRDVPSTPREEEREEVLCARPALQASRVRPQPQARLPELLT